MGLWGKAKAAVSVKAAVKGLFSKRKDHAAPVLDLRGVVVAADIADVYAIQRRLGEGQTAIVYEGRRLADGKTYALKAFREIDSGDGLRDEVEVLRAMPSHPGIVGLTEIVSTPGCVYLAMELVAGGDLLSPIEERGAYREKQAVSLFAQIVDAVDAMHQSTIVHRDLKPENVCFTDQGRNRIKIIDMGAAGFLSESGLSDLCGTPLYAAPEVTPWFFAADNPSAREPNKYDERVDLWSMGVALYVMLTGAAPFDQEQPVEALLKQVCKGKLAMSSPDWRGISNDAKAVVRGLLAVDPARRLPMAELRGHPWLREQLEQLQREKTLFIAEKEAEREEAEAGANPANDDPELHVGLSYLSRCVRRHEAAAAARMPMGTHARVHPHVHGTCTARVHTGACCATRRRAGPPTASRSS